MPVSSNLSTLRFCMSHSDILKTELCVCVLLQQVSVYQTNYGTILLNNVFFTG